MSLDLRTLTFAKACFEAHMLFGSLDQLALTEFLNNATISKFPSGKMIFQKGDLGTQLYLISEGRVRISTISEDGKEIILNILESGEIFGEIAFLDGKDRTATAVATEDCNLISISRATFTSLMSRHPEVVCPLIEVLCARLRWVSEAYEDAIFHHLPQRLARKLLSLTNLQKAPNMGAVPFMLPISQADLGRTLGMSREKINRQLKYWQRSGIVSLKRGEIWINDRAYLSRAANPEP